MVNKIVVNTVETKKVIAVDLTNNNFNFDSISTYTGIGQATVNLDVIDTALKVIDVAKQGLQGPVGPQGPQGDTGPQGPQGDPGVGVPTGGSTGQVLTKVSGTDYDTDWQTPGAALVTSVFGRTGAVVAQSGDYNTDLVTEGVTNLYDKTVVLNNGTGINVTGAYPNFTIANTSPSSGGTVTQVDTTAPLSGGPINTTGTISITQSSSVTDGYLSLTDWNTFNNKVSPTRSITTVAPLAGGGDLSADRSLSITQAGAASDGYLSSVDWNTFNNKQAVGNYITALTGDGIASGPGSVAFTLATVNANVGTFGSATQVAQPTVNAKGLITAITNVLITPAASSITGGQALTEVNDTNVTMILGGAPATSLLQAVSMTLGWTGQLAVTRGGTGLSTVSQGDLLFASALNTLTTLPKDTNSTRYLSNTGASNGPAWAQVNLTNGVTGVLPVTNGGTGTGSAFTLGSVIFAGGGGVFTQDNANFFWDDTNNRLGIGATNPVAGLEVVNLTQTGNLFGNIISTVYGTASGGGFKARTARGTVGSPSQVLTDDYLCFFGGQGYSAVSGFATNSSGFVSINASQAYTATANGSYIAFWTTPNNSTTQAERIRISQDGYFGMGTTGTISAWMHLNRPASASLPVFLINSSWFAGATGPQILIQASTAAAYSGNANGTAFAINSVSGFTGNFIDIKENGVTTFTFSGTSTSPLMTVTAASGANNAKILFTGQGNGTDLTIGSSNSSTFPTSNYIIAGSTRINIVAGNAGSGSIGLNGTIIITNQKQFVTSNGRVWMNTDENTGNVQARTTFGPTNFPANGTTESAYTFNGAVNGVVGSTVALVGVRYSQTITPNAATPLVIASQHSSTLIASANNQLLYGISLSQTFTPGAFTGVLAAMLKIGAGSATAAPLELTAGTVLTTARAGVLEYDGTNLFFTRVATRQTVFVGSSGGVAPATTPIGPIVSFYGTSSTIIMGAPVGFFDVVEGGTTKKVPYY